MTRAVLAGIALAVLTTSALGSQLDLRLRVCYACHGEDGVSQTPLTPSLSGQPSFFLSAQLFLFREGRRDNAEMTAVAKGMKDADLIMYAESFSRFPPPAAAKEKPDAARMGRGIEIAQKERCMNCHGTQFEGDKNVPRIANQREDYLLKALRDYKSGKRIGYGNAVMPETVSGLSDAELADVAHALSMFGR